MTNFSIHPDLNCNINKNNPSNPPSNTSNNTKCIVYKYVDAVTAYLIFMVGNDGNVLLSTDSIAYINFGGTNILGPLYYIISPLLSFRSYPAFNTPLVIKNITTLSAVLKNEETAEEIIFYRDNSFNTYNQIYTQIFQ